jgi:hypothetical protein
MYLTPAAIAEHHLVVREQPEQQHAIDAALWRRTNALAPSRLATLAHASVG